MTVRYIRVKPIANLFAPAVRAFGNVAVVGRADDPPAADPPVVPLDVDSPVVFTDPADALRRAPGELGSAIDKAFAQSPGPTLVYGVRVDSANPNWETALAALSVIDVQIVTIAATPLDATTRAATGAIGLLAAHVTTVSESGGDGKERIGVAMLTKGSADPEILTKESDDPEIVVGALAHERMVYIAHKSGEDAAAAVAGTIAGYEPHISLLLKQVNISSAPFTPAEIESINGSETEKSGPAGRGVNWLVDPALIPGQAVYLGEAYTGNPGGKKYIDIVRCIDNVSFLLKAQLIKSIGNLRISRSGLRALTAQMEAVLDPLVAGEVIDRYDIVIPLLVMLDKDPSALTPSEDEQIKNARAQRVVEVLAVVDYAGAIHRLSITLKFE